MHLLNSQLWIYTVTCKIGDLEALHLFSKLFFSLGVQNIAYWIHFLVTDNIDVYFVLQDVAKYIYSLLVKSLWGCALGVLTFSRCG